MISCISALKVLASRPAETDGQKFHRVVSQYIQAAHKVFLMEKPQAKDFRRLERSIQQRDQFFKENPQMKLVWEYIIGTTGPGLFIPSSL